MREENAKETHFSIIGFLFPEQFLFQILPTINKNLIILMVILKAITHLTHLMYYLSYKVSVKRIRTLKCL